MQDPGNILWRHKLHNASCLAGMAIGNASVGINHGLAHALGSAFGIPHGRANSVFLLSTVNYNSQIPRKFMCNSAYPLWVADEKYARAAQFLNLPLKHSDTFKSPQAQVADPKVRTALILALRQAIFDLLETAHQPKSISELGISQEALEDALPELVRQTYEDMSIRTNPSCPLIEEIMILFAESYPIRERPTC